MDGKQCAGSVLGLANQIKRVFDTTTGRCGTQVKMEAQDFIRREKVSYDDRLKKILPTSHTVEMKEQVERHITLLEKRLTAGIGAEELEIFSDVLKKMQENMELTERGAGYG